MVRMTDSTCEGLALGAYRVPRARLAGTLALPMAGFLGHGVGIGCIAGASCAARGDARPPRNRIPRAWGWPWVHSGCLVRGSRGRSPSPNRIPRAWGWPSVHSGCLGRGSRGRSPSPKPDSSGVGLALGAYRMPRARLAGTLALPKPDSSGMGLAWGWHWVHSGCLGRGSRGRSPSPWPDSSGMGLVLGA